MAESALPRTVSVWIGKNVVERDYYNQVDTDYLITRAVAMIGSNGRNNAGFWLAVQMRDNDYVESEAISALHTLQRSCPAFNTKGQREPYTLRDIEKTVRSVYSRSRRSPWDRREGTR